MKKTIVIICILITTNIYSDHLFSNSDTYVVVGDNINIRKDSGLNSKVIAQLSIGSEVKIVKTMENQITINNKEGKWVYIDSGRFFKGTRDIIKGWIFNYYIANLKEFKRVTEFGKYKINDWVGDALLWYQFRKDGTYEYKYYDYEKRKKIDGGTGKVYRFRNVIAIKNDRGKEILFINKEGRLCSIFHNMNGDQICSKEKHKNLYIE